MSEWHSLDELDLMCSRKGIPAVEAARRTPTVSPLILVHSVSECCALLPLQALPSLLGTLHKERDGVWFALLDEQALLRAVVRSSISTKALHRP